MSDDVVPGSRILYRGRLDDDRWLIGVVAEEVRPYGLLSYRLRDSWEKVPAEECYRIIDSGGLVKAGLHVVHLGHVIGNLSPGSLRDIPGSAVEHSYLTGCALVVLNQDKGRDRVGLVFDRRPGAKVYCYGVPKDLRSLVRVGGVVMTPTGPATVRSYPYCGSFTGTRRTDITDVLESAIEQEPPF